MLSRKSLLLLLFFVLFAGNAATVISWIPPYGTDGCYDNLQSEWGGFGPKDGLSHIALQFWVPDGSGGVRYVNRSDYSKDYMNDDSVKVVRDWGNQYGIKTMLCLYNGEHGWDWAQGVTAFKTYQDKTIGALLETVDRLDLGGVEIDIEGIGNATSTDSTAYIQFVQKLGDSLEVRGKDLTVATFAYEWNCPNWNWWNAIAPHVTAITSMGYEEIGANATEEWRKYSSQKAKINSPEKLMLGMPDHITYWQGGGTFDHLDWIEADGQCGIGLWDMELRSADSKTKEYWQQIGRIRGALTTQYEITASVSGAGTINPSGKVMVDSASDKTFSFTPEKWYVLDYIEVDGSNKGAPSDYTFTNVVEAHTIKAFFKKDPDAPELYTITTTTNSNGTISPDGVIVVAAEGDTSFTIAGESGYVVDYVKVDGVNRGPLVSADFKGVKGDHTLEAFFKEASGGDLGKYEEWYSSIHPGYLDTVYWNDSLWSYTGDSYGGKWGANMEPSKSLADQYGTPPWTYAGLYNGTPDSTVEASLVYITGDNGKDTLIITTDSSASGAVYKTVKDTVIVNGTPIVEASEIAAGKYSILSDGFTFTAPIAGIYSVKLVDMRGRTIAAKSLEANKAGVSLKLFPMSQFAKGLYILEIQGAGTVMRHKVQGGI